MVDRSIGKSANPISTVKAPAILIRVFLFVLNPFAIPWMAVVLRAFVGV